MYFLKKKKSRGHIFKNKFNFDGVRINSSKKSFEINGEKITNVKVVDYKLASLLTLDVVSRKYRLLINRLMILLTSDDDSGECFREALNQIEKFRIEIKNKYRKYLNKKMLQQMAKQLKQIQKEAEDRYLILQQSYQESLSNGKSR